MLGLSLYQIATGPTLILGVGLLVAAFGLEMRRRRWRCHRAWPIAVGTLAAAILVAGMLSPVMWSAHDGAEWSTCASHVRDNGRCLFMYSNDHDDRFPDAASWIAAARPYGAIDPCPAASSGVGYGMNSALSGLKFAEVEDPAHTVLLFDSDQDSGGPRAVALRHAGTAFIAMADGSWGRVGGEIALKPRWKP